MAALLPWRASSTRVRERRKVFMLVMGVRNGYSVIGASEAGGHIAAS